MMILAGDRDCETTIAKELQRAGIPEDWLSEPRGEVLSRLRGSLGAFLFVRGWSYWIASGPLPLTIAEKLYEHPVARRDVRPCGQRAGVPPATQARWYTSTGAAVLSTNEQAGMKRLHETMSKWGPPAPPALSWSLVYNDEPATIATGYVDVYFIDSEDGLALFAQAIREDAVPAAAPAWWDRRPLARVVG